MLLSHYRGEMILTEACKSETLPLQTEETLLRARIYPYTYENFGNGIQVLCFMTMKEIEWVTDL